MQHAGEANTERPKKHETEERLEVDAERAVASTKKRLRVYTEEMAMKEKAIGEYSKALLVHRKLPEETVIKDNKIVLQNQTLNGMIRKEPLESPFLLTDVVFLKEDTETPPGVHEVYRSRQGLFEYTGQYVWCSVKISKIPDQPPGTQPYLRVGAFDMEAGNIERLIGVGWTSLAEMEMVGDVQIDLMVDDVVTGVFSCRVQLEDDDIWSQF